MLIYEKIHWWARSHYIPREFAYFILTRPAVLGNSLYRRLYQRRIENRIRSMLKFPHTIAIESSAFCNANCLLCTRKVMKRKLGVMSNKLYCSLIEQIKQHPRTRLYLSGFGEPLMDKNLADKVAFAKDAGIEYVGFFTNGSLLTPKRAQELVEAGLTAIDVSIDGATPETYNAIRPNLDFDVVINNLRHLSSIRRQGRPMITVDVILTPQNEREKRSMRKLMQGIADKLIFRRPESWAGQITLPNGIKTPHSAILPSYRSSCIHLWSQVNIYWDGTVPLCCRDFDAKVPLGNSTKQSIIEIWHSEITNQFREAHLEGRFQATPLCRDCQYFSIWW